MYTFKLCNHISRINHPGDYKVNVLKNISHDDIKYYLHWVLYLELFECLASRRDFDLFFNCGPRSYFLKQNSSGVPI